MCIFSTVNKYIVQKSSFLEEKKIYGVIQGNDSAFFQPLSRVANVTKNNRAKSQDQPNYASLTYISTKKIEVNIVPLVLQEICLLTKKMITWPESCINLAALVMVRNTKSEICGQDLKMYLEKVDINRKTGICSYFCNH